ncbi:hypothetical protein CANMA_001289 [Candida margitis]|uniref:uncharacterized protein n=1 Tax=Candida margitis TaxID=1775924 RepID=UPI002225C68F|nr:uncharacterized protein CANMA_001289 [Candida margitis]KAI5969626.1 hypothetical protein CANMA_001289 [Candida margitis]
MGNLHTELFEQVNHQIEEAFEKLRKEDQDTIQKLREENSALKAALRLREEELATLRSHGGATEARSSDFASPTEGPSVSLFTKSSQKVHSVSAKDETSNIAPVDNIYLLPTQYSDTDEEGSVFNKTSSPLKVNYSSRRGSVSGSTSSKSIIVGYKKETLQPKSQLTSMKSGSSPSGSPPRKIACLKSTELKEDEDADENTPPTSQGNIGTENDVEVEQIADSQEEEDKLISQTIVPVTPSPPPIEVPKNLTIIQTRQFLTRYYTNMLKTNPNFKINLYQHPIKQISWDFSDFVANKNYKPDNFTQFIKRNSIMDTKKFNQYKQFYKYDHNGQEFEDKLSQIFDKFESPPGFMQSDFPSTQELDERRRTVQERQSNRVARRIASCVSVENRVQIGEFVFGLDILNQYVIQGRWYSNCG